MDAANEDDEHDDDDDHNLANFQARRSRLCMVIDLNNT